MTQIRHKILPCLSVVAMSASLAWAADDRPATEAQLGGPVLGYASETDGSIRPILGVPGSSILGASASFTGLTSLVVSPAFNMALGVEGEQGRLVLLRNLSESLLTEDIGAAEPGVDAVFFSPGSRAAVVFDRDTGRLTVIEGFPDAPRVAWSLDAIGPVAQPERIAVSDDGAVVIAAAGNGEKTLLVATKETGAVSVASVSNISSLSFVAGTHDALVADGVGNRVLMVRDVAATAAAEEIAGPEIGILDPIAVSSSLSGRVAVIIHRGSPAILLRNLLDGSIISLDCPCNPASLDRLRGDATFKIDHAPPGPIWLLDAESSQPRVVFVPGTPPETAASSNTAVEGGAK